MMSSTLDSSNLSNIIQTSTKKIITQTEENVKAVNEVPLGEDTITIMINGTETKLNSDDYKSIKASNNEVHLKMKADLKKQIKDFKDNLKEDLKNQDK